MFRFLKLYKKRIQEKEIEEKRIQEQRLQEKYMIKENLINEIRDNYISISNGINKITEVLYDESHLREIISNNTVELNDELFKRFEKIILEIYSISYNIDDCKELAEKVFKYQFIDKISKKYLSESDYRKIRIQYKNSVCHFKEENNQCIKEENNEYIEVPKYIGNECIDFHSEGCLQGIHGGFRDVFDNLKNDELIILTLFKEQNKEIYSSYYYSNSDLDFKMNYFSWSDGLKNILCFIRQIFYAYIIVYYIIFLRKVKQIKENKEVMCILKNIKKEAKLNIKGRCRSFNKQELEHGEILSKFYPIYNNFYKNIFKYELEKTEIESLLLALKNNEKSYPFIKNDYYEKIIKDFENDRNLKRLLDGIDENVFFEQYKEHRGISFIDKGELYIELFTYIIIHTIDYLDNDDILDIIYNRNTYINRLKKNSELKNAFRDKDKYLNEKIKDI